MSVVEQQENFRMVAYAIMAFLIFVIILKGTILVPLGKFLLSLSDIVETERINAEKALVDAKNRLKPARIIVLFKGSFVKYQRFDDWQVVSLKPESRVSIKRKFGEKWVEREVAISDLKPV